MSENIQREYLTVAELQEVLGIGSTKAYQLLQSGEIPAVRVGRALRVCRRDLDEWAQQNQYVEPAR